MSTSIYKVPQDALENRKTLFLSSYDSDYQNSGTKLYTATVQPQGTFQENLGDSVRRYTKNDRKKTQEFLLGVMQLLLQAAKIELAYLNVKSFDANALFMKTQWEERIQSVKTEFERVDNAVISKYHEQSGVDLVDFAAANTGMNNQDFATSLYNMLSGKYYWRHWVVLAYNPIWEQHTVTTCGGHIRFRQNGREGAPIMDINRGRREMTNVEVSKIQIISLFSGIHKHISLAAKDVYDSLSPVQGACEVAVIQCDGGVYYASYGNRFVSVDRCPYFKLNMWG